MTGMRQNFPPECRQSTISSDVSSQMTHKLVSQNTSMKSSPCSRSSLPVVYNVPPSPCNISSRKNSSLGIMQAVTLSACSAAFAATATALLCFLVINSHPGNLLDNRVEVMNLLHSDKLDSPEVIQSSIKCDQIESRIRTDFNQNESSFHSRDFTRRILNNGRNMVPPLERSEHHGVKSSEPLGVVWLMSFPNSGTSYTIHTVREMTNTTTATNYGLEGDIKDQESVPVFKNIAGAENGPYFELIPGRVTEVPKWILTKTHCGGFCTSCKSHSSYIDTPRVFQRSCLEGLRGIFSDKNNTEGMTRIPVSYSSDLISKVVHLFRNPMDNVVARFHLERNIRMKKDEEWPNEYPNSKDGFKKYCDLLDSVQTISSISWVDSNLAETMSGVPCVSEFFRYVQWHNLAFSVTSDLEVPSFTFHYEDYSNRFEDITNELLNFLELERVGEAPEFIDNKQYGDYYSEEEKRRIAIFLKELSTKRTWDNVEHYLTDFLPVQSEKSNKENEISAV